MSLSMDKPIEILFENAKKLLENGDIEAALTNFCELISLA
jgi:hypothetical protein